MYLDITNITEATLQELIQNRIFENKELEYKDYSFVDGKIEDKAKTKLMQEIVAFANTYGGQIVIGIKEDQDHLPTEISGTNAKIGDFDGWLSSFRQIVLSRIRPHLHGIEYTPVSLQDGNLAIVITVPKSLARPHSFWRAYRKLCKPRLSDKITTMEVFPYGKERKESHAAADRRARDQGCSRRAGIGERTNRRPNSGMHGRGA